MIFKLFSDHPATVGETYGQHFRQAACFSGAMFWGGFACLVHAFVPALFQKTGSRSITELHDRMVRNRTRVAADPELREGSV